jgi:type II secretory pathway pseudopilin PulG
MQKGFTLIEITVYIAISSFIMVTLISLTLSFSSIILTSLLKAETEKEGDLLLSFIDYNIGNNQTPEFNQSSAWPIASSTVLISTTSLNTIQDIKVDFTVSNQAFNLERYVSK